MKWLLPLLLLRAACAFEAHFDVLYWKPCTSAYQWGKLNNQQLYVTPDYDWGFRLGGKCRQWELSWTYFHTEDSNAEINPNLQIYVPGLTTADAGKARTLFTYNKVNLRGSCSIFYAGVRWAKIRRTNALSSTTGTVNERALFQGGGFELGLSASYCICNNLRVKGSLGSFAIIGEQESTYTFNDLKNRIPAKADCVYGIDFQIALASEWPCGCISLFGEIGYEMETYFKALTLIKTIPLRTNISFAGPYFRLGARF